MKSTSKNLIRSVFRSAEGARPVFVPLICSLAAQLEQVTVREMLTDPTLLSNSLAHAQDLFGFDAVAVIYDPTLEAEALGCRTTWRSDEELPESSSHPLDEGVGIDDLDATEIESQGRIPIVLEATKRLVTSIGKEVAVFGVVTGPVTLARCLKATAFTDGSEALTEEADLFRLAGKAILRLCRGYCELGVDGVLLVEQQLNPMHRDLFISISSVFQTIKNVAKFYNVNSLILVRECSNDSIDSVFTLPGDGALIGTSTSYERIERAAAQQKRSFGICIPNEVMLASPARVAQFLPDALVRTGKKGFFVSTQGDMPFDTPIANVHQIVNSISGSFGASPAD